MQRYSSWAAALLLLLALVGALPAEETRYPVESSSGSYGVASPIQSLEGFGNIARLQAALAEQKAADGETSRKIIITPQVKTSTGLFGLFAAACEATDECAGETCSAAICSDETCCTKECCADGVCDEENCCASAKCQATTAALATCATTDCPASHCAAHGCAASCATAGEGQSCPSACTLHECPQVTARAVALPVRLSALLGTAAGRFTSTTDESSKSICQTKSCARLASATASCCCKDGEECGCQSDSAAVPEPPTNAAADKTWQLFQAAEHLEAAGLTVHAREIRAHAERAQRAHKEAALTAKIAELTKLQAEIEALSKSLAGPPQVMVQVTVLEMHADKLKAFGFDLDALVRKSESESLIGAEAKANTDHTLTVGVFDDGCEVLQVVETLEKCNLLKRIAEPSLMTMSGRPATVLLGGEFPTLIPQFPIALAEDGNPKTKLTYCEFGTRVNVCPVVIGDNELQLQLSPRVTELTKIKSSPDSEQVVNQLRIRFDANSTALMKPGQTLLMLAMPAEGKSDESAVILLATPSLVKKGEADYVAPAAYTPYTATLPTPYPQASTLPLLPNVSSDSVRYFEAAPGTETTEALK